MTSVSRALLRQNVEPAFGGYLVATFRHQHRHFRLQAAGNADHFIGRGHFKVQLDLGQVTQAPDIGILDMATIFPQMNRNAVGATEMGLDGAPDGIRFVGNARLPQRCDVVDIDAKFDHGSCNSLNILRVSSSLPPR